MIRSHPWRLFALAASACLLALPGTASAEHVRCGDAITENTTLDSDVVCTGAEFDPLKGLVIARDRVTLNLNGFAIRGPNRGEQVEEVQAGVLTDGPHRGVAIRNGTITGFSEGLVLELSDSRIRHMTSFGRLSLRGDGNVVRDNSVSDGDTGLALRGDDNRILRNDAFGNDGDGIDVGGARNGIVANTARSFISDGIHVSGFSDVEIAKNVTTSGVGSGIAVVDGSSGLVEKNVATGARSAPGIVVLADDLLIRKNHASENERGIYVYGAGNTVRQNVANDNGEHLDHFGIYVVPGNFDGGGNRARGNGAPEQCFGVTCR